MPMEISKDIEQTTIATYPNSDANYGKQQIKLLNNEKNMLLTKFDRHFSA